MLDSVHPTLIPIDDILKNKDIEETIIPIYFGLGPKIYFRKEEKRIWLSLQIIKDKIPLNL